MIRIGIVGAGAAGCFCAIHVKELCPEAHVSVFEAANRPLAKVAITGGGRCNLTNSFHAVRQLAHVYPRGERLMKKLFAEWNHRQTMQWFEQAGVRLVTQDDGCVFPRSQDAREIVDTLLSNIRHLGVKLSTRHRVTDIEPLCGGYRLTFADAAIHPVECDIVVVTIGGCPSRRQLQLLDKLSVEVSEPVPSLFTFNITDAGLRELMGCVVEDVAVSLAGTKFRATGPLLVTHWGVSGPAILRLSSHAARHLAECEYRSTLCVNWFGDCNEEDIRCTLLSMQQSHPQRQMRSEYPSRFTARLWQFLLTRAQIELGAKWCDLAGKKLNRLVSVLSSDTYVVDGKSRFKEEFVTCGGVSLAALQGTSMELKSHPGVYLAGEVLDVDAVTGGFNLQAAWTMGYAVARQIAISYSTHSEQGNDDI